jgi:hypothetical protein
LAAGILAACGRFGAAKAADEGADLPIEVTVENPVDSPAAAALADPCSPVSP